MSWTLLVIASSLAAASFAPAVARPSPAGAASGTARLTDSVETVRRTPQALAHGASADDRAAFTLTVGVELVPYRVMAAFVLPGEDVPVEVASADSGFDVHVESGTIRKLSSHLWTWRSPSIPGAYALRVTPRDPGEAITVNAFVMVPYSRMRRGCLGGYRIGRYPAPRAHAGANYDRPRGFIEVTTLDDSTRVSPHFRLGQFVCKQGRRYPKYMVLKPALLVKLERLLDTVHRNGVEASTFQVMSGYRTPAYNRRIGNVTTFTRHQYGDAADIFVDEHPADGVMDDLNHDGCTDRRDAERLRAWAEALDRAPDSDVRAGGLSDYGSTEAHGPFVHIDARGYAARW